MRTPPTIRLSYALARAHIGDGDLLLFRSHGLIAAAGRSVYSHAGKAAWWGADLFCIEVHELAGGRAVTLESQIRRRPGRIDLYRVNPCNLAGYDRRGSVIFMRKFCGCGYGWRNLGRIALRHLPLFRLLVRPGMSDAEVTLSHPTCAHAIAMADRLGGGVDPVPNLADRLTEPADLARSRLYKYQFTLVP